MSTKAKRPHVKRSARHMEILGNILNGMDATEEADAWMEPVFQVAQHLWPNAIAK